ncbi:luciferase-like monooxygenase family protein [Mycolicibacterium hassiacum DSM 44199]|uniref:Luciferase-like monooxygenase family protein n=1 Tax=Mycolicibacterium hassiacum (strain DSM 44199 / CIP 105218 / JCM 12690 / 3849) TaxID=1122247 RepID=K5BGQ1_MYCHD|nr:LLM class flavin-dependent oxidoreductase [Mycolicibacterium hassiacum]EKF24982.1 luciferase-like monooxygenase family protein [Mycolicibacterium hassiacum DSM 44199]MBX5488398.1 LLM class flavin-dependent oxidoreductase [Mycolicibacterium hassiacum]MDA4088101.1 alkanesulfonate monooxygenase [Mycolicibacterium hassiacum DSM 44199]VCT88447.1 Alkanesulfonate monooxygenase [Mycolicibacterium hassiacum DSM 44199]
MTIQLHWFLPTYGDSRLIVGGGHGTPIGAAHGDRDASIDYLASIVRAAESFGFTAALIPTGAWCEDSFITASLLARETTSLGFLVAFRPGLVSPTLSAQMAATFARHQPGRILLNVVVGGEAHEQRSFGDYLDKDSRYRRADEFLEVVRRLWAGETVSYDGEYVKVEGATVPTPPNPIPPLYFGGSSAAAGPVAARHADVYLTWGEPLDAVRDKIAWIRGLAEQEGRQIRFGIRLHTISRDTSEEAWAQAGKLLAALDEETVRKTQEGLHRSQSEGQKRMLALHEEQRRNGTWHDARSLEIAPNLWAGVGLVRGGAGTALVGSHLEVADRIADYAELGIEEFILSGYPHLEELYWFGEGVVPVLRERGLYKDAAPATAPASIPFVSGSR